jgi:DNA-directed RNA polymerase specialized sigma24 family protein
MLDGASKGLARPARGAAAPGPSAVRHDPDDAATLRALVATAAGGDTGAMATLLARLAPTVVRAVRVVLGPGAAASGDVSLQALQALTDIMRAVPSFGGECHPASHAARIAVHTALTAGHRGRDRRVLFLAPVDVPEVSPFGWNRRDSDALALYRRHFLRDLLLRLPEDQAEVLALHVLLGHSLPEIATTTATPLATVEDRLRLAKESVRRFLTGPGPRRGDS